MNALELRNVKKQFEGFALDVSLSLPEGSVLGLIGANGAGKSTTIKLILDLLQADEGSIELFGQDYKQPVLREEIGVVFDECCFPSELTAKEIGIMLAGCYQNWDGEAYTAYLKKFGLPAEKKMVREYSRGMQMKLQLAVAFSHKARLFLLDEPTGGLDPIVRNEILDLLWEFMQDERCSVLISSHITTDLEKIADYIVYLDQGKVLLCDEKDTLLSNYYLVRGSKALLQRLPKTSLTGVRENSFGFEALTKEKGLFEAYPELKFSSANLEEIMLHLVQQ